MSENEEKKDVVDKVADGVETAAEKTKEFAGEAKEAMKETAGDLKEGYNEMFDGDIPEAKKSMVMGIVGAALFMTGIGGIIFGIIGMKNAKLAMAKVMQDPTKFKKEKVKATIGKFAGLFGVIFGAIYAIVWIGMIVAAAAS